MDQKNKAMQNVKKKDGQIRFLLPSALKNDFFRKARRMKSTPSIMLRSFIEEFIGDDDNLVTNKKQSMG